MKSRLHVAVAAAAMFVTMATTAATVSLDFDTSATGLDLATTPLVTAAGTVSLTATGIVSIQAGGTGTNGIWHAQQSDTDRALLSFDFDVSSIVFDFAGQGSGDFLAEALDIHGSVIASYSFLNTVCADCFDGTGIVLAGSGIRALRFADTPGAFNFSFIDNVRLESATLSSPSTLACAGVALAGMLALRRKTPRRT